MIRTFFSTIMRYFLYLSYNGTAYHGWQVQPNGVTVQELVKQALTTVLRQDIELVGAGRTDAKVHAKEMVAHFDTDNDNLESEEFIRRLNSILPQDIAVHKLLKVKPDAHARFDAISRKYEYHIYFDKHVFKENLAVRMYHPLDFDAMNEAADVLKEYQDFTSFSKLHTNVKTNNCKIYEAYWECRGDEWVFTIKADRFLRNMVRAIVGTLFDVGTQKIKIDDLRTIIEAKDRCKAGVSVAPHGLYLVELEYPQEIFI